jgi:hypothetical protein
MNGWECSNCGRNWSPWVKGCEVCNAPDITSVTTDATMPDTDELTDEDVIEEMSLYKPHDSELIAKLWRVARRAHDYMYDCKAQTLERLDYALDDLDGLWIAEPQTDADATPQPHSVTAEIDSFVTNEGKGNVRDALNIALNRLNIAKEVNRIQGERHDADTALARAVRGMPVGAALEHLPGPPDGWERPWMRRLAGTKPQWGTTPEEALGIAQEVKP